MAEFWRALRTLKALQAELALRAEQALEDGPTLAVPPLRPPARPPLADRSQPNEPETDPTPRERADCARRHPARVRRPWLPDEPGSDPDRRRAGLTSYPSSRRIDASRNR
jgi:hypothetical protein